MLISFLQYIPLIAAALAIMSCVASFFIQLSKRFDKKFDIIIKRLDDQEKRSELLEDRIFQLAMGKTLREAMREEGMKSVKG